MIHRTQLAQRGAALLAAMLTVTLVASLAAAGLWRQWRNAEVEGAERMHLQAQWVLTGALDWARLILREDARSGGADHLAEPWAIPLEEARLSTFLAADRSGSATDAEADDASQVFLSGNIADLQARMNVFNLVEGGKISDPDLKAFAKLFELLGLPPTELDLLASNLLQSQAIGTPAKPISPLAPLPPQRVEHLAWLGLSAPTLAALEPYIIWLPQRTTVNINTASVTVLYASSPRMDMARAQALSNARKLSHFKTLDDANKLIGSAADPLVDANHSVNSRYFLVKGRQRQDQTVVQQQSVVYRDGLDVKTLWRTNVAPPLGESALQ
jgi:general secretion pathway protein K